MSPLLLLTTALALPQADPGPVDAHRFPLPDQVLFDDVGDGARWALGRSYKASVDEDGFLFVPFVGGDSDGAPGARFAVRSASVGGEALDLGPAVVERTGDALVLDRGALVERYECRLDAVEQFLEVDLGGLAGDLRVDVRVDSTLRRPEEARAPLTFGGPGGSVRVGEAYVAREGGAKVAIDATRTADGYTIFVPGDVVAAAGDSILIDPVISSGTVTSNAFRTDVVADTASIGSLGFFVAVERAFSATDSDVFVYRVSATPGGPVSFVATIDFTTTSWSEPAIAGADSLDELMVVATRGLGTGRRVYARSASADGNSVGVPFNVSFWEFEAFSPDIGADSNGSFLIPRYCVVWNDIDLGGTQTPIRMIDRNGPATSPALVEFGVIESSLPAVSNGSGDIGFNTPTVFRVVHKETDAAGAESIWATDYDRDLVEITPTWKIADVENTQRVSVASSNESRLSDGSAPYVVVWDSGFPGFGEIFAATCVDGAVRGDVSNLTRMSDARSNRDRRRPAVAATEDRWIVTWQERPVALGAWTIVMASGDVTPLGFGLGERDQYLLPGSDDRTNASVVTRYEGGASGAAGDLGFAVWVNESGSTRTEGGYLEPVDDDVAGVQYCEANQSSSGRRAWMAAFGDNSVSSPHVLRCTDAPAGVPCFVLTSRQSAFVPNVGGGSGNLCLGGAGFGRFSNQIGPTDSSGTYSLSLDPTQIAQPTGTVAAVAGETWYFQAWFRDASGGIPTSNLSNGVAVGFAP